MIERRARGYQIRWRDADGTQRKEMLRGTREDAEQREREILVLRDRGRRVTNPKDAPTFGAFADAFVEERRAGWKHSTRLQYTAVLTNHLRPAFAALRVSLIEEPHVRRFLTRCHDVRLSARRTNLALVLLKGMLHRAGRLYGFETRWLDDVRLLAEPDAEVDPLSPGEVAAFLAGCPPWWRPYFVTALFTGARPNELAALKWGDVDARRASFRIRAGRYRGVEGLPKTRASIRDVDLLARVVEALQQQKAQQAAQRLRGGQGAPLAGQDYVFTGPAGGLLNPNWVRDRVWVPTLAAAGLRRRTVYQTRHSFVSNALEAGESPQWVARMIGHKNLRLLFERYAKWIPNRTRQDGSALAAHVGAEASAPKDAAMRPESAPLRNAVREA